MIYHKEVSFFVLFISVVLFLLLGRREAKKKDKIIDVQKVTILTHRLTLEFSIIFSVIPKTLKMVPASLVLR